MRREIFNLPFVSTLDTNLFRPLVSARYVYVNCWQTAYMYCNTR